MYTQDERDEAEQCEKEENERQQSFVECSACGKPAWIIHDLDMTECCHAPVKKEKDDEKRVTYPTARPYPTE